MSDKDHDKDIAVEYLISIILERRQNAEYNTCTKIFLEKHSKNISEVFQGTRNIDYSNYYKN